VLLRSKDGMLTAGSDKREQMACSKVSTELRSAG
jgi:hypothetical protein